VLRHVALAPLLLTDDNFGKGNTMPTELSDLEIDEVSLVTKAANNRKFLIFKSMESDQMSDHEPAGANGTAGASGAQVVVQKADLEAMIQKAIEDDRTTRDADIKKAIDAAIAKEQAEKAEIQKQLDIERDIRVTKEFIEKAGCDLPNLPGTTPANMGPVLKEAQEKLSEASYKALYDILKASSAALGESNVLFKSLGSDIDAPAAGTAEARLDALVEARVGEIRKSADGRSLDPTVAKAVAYQQIMKENPDLVVQHRREYLASAGGA